MSEMSHACEDHSQAIFVSGFDGLLVTDRATGLDDGLDSCFGDFFHVIREWEEGIRSKDSTVKAVFGLVNRNTNRSHTVGLTRAQRQVSCGHSSR